MATAFKTPGVYVEEISKFPPSVAQVETAIPAFVGYTEKAVVDGKDFHRTGNEVIKPIKINSLPEYEYFFGDAPDPTSIEAELNSDNSVKQMEVNGINLLYDSIRMFYANGGGECYIVSVGGYNKTTSGIKKDKLLTGLASLKKVDQPTLLIIPESVHLSLSASGEVHSAMLTQCDKLQDRFAVMDVKDGDKEISPSINPIKEFRGSVGMNHLKYGAAYYPWLKTTLSFKVSYDTIINGFFKDSTGSDISPISSLFNSDIVSSINEIKGDIGNREETNVSLASSVANKGELKSFAEKLYNDFKSFFDLSTTLTSQKAIGFHAKSVSTDSIFSDLLQLLFDYDFYSNVANNSGNVPGTWTNTLLNGISDFSTHFGTFSPATARASNNIYSVTNTAVKAAPYFKALAQKFIRLVEEFYAGIEELKQNEVETLEVVDSTYSGIVNSIKKQGVVLPPSGAMVGIYAMVDSNRGVWKAPANVSLTAVKGPTVNVTHEEQEDLNVDVTAGKSVNAIRAFTGKGTLVWGARTLAGNDNEWRYISVRRFFIMVEESVKKASSQFVFEPNDANTWVKVRAMIENFLSLQWRAGALVGAKPQQAYYVRVGLGQTMTAEDILNGRMTIEIGMAVARPAEFIVLKFSHKMQEA